MQILLGSFIQGMQVLLFRQVANKGNNYKRYCCQPTDKFVVISRALYGHFTYRNKLTGFIINWFNWLGWYIRLIRQYSIFVCFYHFLNLRIICHYQHRFRYSYTSLNEGSASGSWSECSVWVCFLFLIMNTFLDIQYSTYISY